jgi:hypothetical protein
MLKIPKTVPENGFYYHYKHDPNGEINNYAYEVLGVGCHTEDDCREEDVHMVVYRPLYESSVYKAGKLFDLRPLEMWLSNEEKTGKGLPRFRKITDTTALAALMKIKEQMYTN